MIADLTKKKKDDPDDTLSKSPKIAGLTKMNENNIFLQDFLQTHNIEKYLDLEPEFCSSSVSGSSSEARSDDDLNRDGPMYCRGELIETSYEDRMGSLFRRNACCLTKVFKR